MDSVVAIETPSLGNRAYLAISAGRAVAVDVPRDIDRVEEALDRSGATLAAVVETHVHNDYLSGGLHLSRKHRVDYLVPAGPELGFEARRVVSGDHCTFGDNALEVIATPGHTDAHAAYAFRCPNGNYAFTGGSILYGSTGRTDLLGSSRAEELARAQYWSARRLARLLTPDTELLPTHGFGSFCSAGPVVEGGSTLAAQLELNPAFLLDEEGFVRHLLGGLGPFPSYYAEMGPWNAAGPEPWSQSGTRLMDAEQVRLAMAAGATVIDTRARALISASHIPGSLAIDATGSLATWAGWLADPHRPIVLVAESDEQLRGAERELARIGVDGIQGASLAPDGFDAPWAAQFHRTTFADLAAANTAPQLIDVRMASEWRTGHVKGSINIPLPQLPGLRGLDGLDAPWISCGVGFRAAIAVSMLARAGVEAVLVDEPIAAARRARLPWCEAPCPCQVPASDRDLAAFG